MAPRQRQAKPQKRDGKDANAEQRYRDAVRRARELDIPISPTMSFPSSRFRIYGKGPLA